MRVVIIAQSDKSLKESGSTLDKGPVCINMCTCVCVCGGGGGGVHIIILYMLQH